MTAALTREFEIMIVMWTFKFKIIIIDSHPCTQQGHPVRDSCEVRIKGKGKVVRQFQPHVRQVSATQPSLALQSDSNRFTAR